MILRQTHLCAIVAVAWAIGCSQEPPPKPIRVNSDTKKAIEDSRPKKPAASDRSSSPRGTPDRSLAELLAAGGGPDEPREGVSTGAPASDGSAESTTTPAGRTSTAPNEPIQRRLPPADPPRTFDDGVVHTAGLRKLTGKHITLYTDVGSSPAVDELPAVFDAALPQWCQYFHLDEADLAAWRVNCFLMADHERFRAIGMIPHDLPHFLHGYARDHEIWLNEQPTDYYRRHLVLHEGTHAIMRTRLGGCGPPWYMEGMAELLGTHRWANGQLTLGVFPATREEAPGWGRVKIVKEAYAVKQAQPIANVLALPGETYLRNEPYGWSWAAATFLDGHPKYQERFRKMYGEVLQSKFNQVLRERFRDDWMELCEEWQVFVADLEYGYDLKRAAVEFRAGAALSASNAKAAIAADRGWQSTGVTLEAGKTYRLRASGRYQVAKQPAILSSEPNGISFRYYHGQPLGVLLAAVRPNDLKAEEISPFLTPVVIGLGAALTPVETGTLYLRVNDSAAELADNAGQLVVEVVPEK